MGLVRADQPNWRPELVRKRINVSACIGYLQACARGKIRLTADRLKAIEILLAKSIPNLNTIDVNIDGNATITVISDTPRSITQWEAQAENYLVAAARTPALIGGLSTAGDILRGSEGRGED